MTIRRVRAMNDIKRIGLRQAGQLLAGVALLTYSILLAPVCHGLSNDRTGAVTQTDAGLLRAGPTRTAEDVLRCQEMEHERLAEHEKTTGRAARRVALPAEPVRLRSAPIGLPEGGCADAARRWNFYEYSNQARGCFVNAYLEDDLVVSDLATGLMWERGASDPRVSFQEAQQHVRDLNAKAFAGFSDWRLPTTEETLSLMESFRFHLAYLDDGIFDPGWQWWTSDRAAGGDHWVVDARHAACVPGSKTLQIMQVRAVRSMTGRDLEAARRKFGGGG